MPDAPHSHIQTRFISTVRRVDTKLSIQGGGPLDQDLNISLVNDQDPEGFQYYGTDIFGVRGWYGAFIASGPQHSAGLVPDPGPIAGTTRYLCEDGLWKVVISGGGGGSGTSMSNPVAQTGHGLSVGDVVRYTGSSYVRAKADTSGNAEVVGLVTAVTDSDNFTITTGGLVAGLSGLTAGSVYFLSTATAGLLTTTAPSVDGQISKPLLIASSTTGGYWFNWRGWTVGSPVGGGGSGGGGPVAWTDITGKPSTFPPTVPIAWTDISGKPSTFPPTLPIAQSGITNLVTDLAGKEPSLPAGGTTSNFLRGDKTWAVPAGGTGTVTSVSTGSLSPLFAATITNATTTPALSFLLSDTLANTVFSNVSGFTDKPQFSTAPRFLKIGNLTTNGFVKTGSSDGTLSVDTSTYLTANQNISLTGDVTGGPAATSIATTIGANKVTLGMMATLAADSVIGNTSASPATPAALTSLPWAYTGDVTRAADSNTTAIATDAVTTAKILNSNVTYAKIQNVTATSRFLGRITAAAGVVEELTAANAKTILALTSTDVGLGSVTNDVQTKASVVPNTLPTAGQLLIGNSGATAYAPVTMGTDATISSAGALTIANNAVTLGKMATMATDSILGRSTATTGNVEVLASLPWADTGDVTRAADGKVTVLANIPIGATLGGVAGVQGDIIYRDASGWNKLAAGTNGNQLTTHGAGANPTWDAPGSGGGGSPGGSITQVQFYDTGGVFGGDAGLTYNKTTDTLAVGTITGDGTIPAGGATLSLLAKSSGANYDVGWTNSGTGIATLTSGVLGVISNNSANWDTAFTQTRQWDGGATGLVAATGRTSLALDNVTNDAQTQAAIVPNTVPTDGQLLVGSTATNKYFPRTMFAGGGASITISTAGGIAFTSIPNSWLLNPGMSIAGTTVNLGGAIALGPTVQKTLTATTSSTYTVPATCRALWIQACGGGGGGGGAKGTGSSAMVSGGGAGGGFVGLYIASPAATYTYQCGTGGAGGVATPGGGTTGNPTTFGALSATGGAGGATGSAGTALGIGGNGGNGVGGSGGTISIVSGDGTAGLIFSASGGIAGQGGSSPRFTGTTRGPGGVTAAAGVAGSNYGGGGSGAISNSATGQVGGAGANGIIQVTEYY